MAPISQCFLRSGNNTCGETRHVKRVYQNVVAFLRAGIVFVHQVPSSTEVCEHLDSYCVCVIVLSFLSLMGEAVQLCAAFRERPEITAKVIICNIVFTILELVVKIGWGAKIYAQVNNAGLESGRMASIPPSLWTWFQVAFWYAVAALGLVAMCGILSVLGLLCASAGHGAVNDMPMSHV